ncbi:MAG: CAP domain-containing protein [Terriglobales bacterium]
MMSVRMGSRLKIAIATLVVLGSLPAAAAATKLVRDEKIEQRIFKLVNQAREEKGLDALKWNHKLGVAAAEHLVKMMEKRRLSHRFPNELALSERIAATGLRFNAAAENVGYATDWEDLHSGWMRSPGHRANILNTKYDEVGIAVSLGPNGYYAVQNFAHTTSESGTKEAEARWAAALRREVRREIAVTFSPRIREAVCAMAERDKVDAKQLPVEPPRRRMFAYTTSEPDALPPGLVEAARGANIAQIDVGVCYRVTEKYPGGTYWVGAVY